MTDHPHAYCQIWNPLPPNCATVTYTGEREWERERERQTDTDTQTEEDKTWKLVFGITIFFWNTGLATGKW